MIEVVYNMPISLRESLRKKMANVVKLYELFVMKDYLQVQADVLHNLAMRYGHTETRNINGFLMSPMGQFAMKAYRKILIDKYGEDTSKPKNPNTDIDPGFFKGDTVDREKLVNQITNIIIMMYNKEQKNV